MRIVSVLASGVAGAKNGTATLTKRGASGAAQWFRDFEGDDPATLGDVVQLDAFGSATIYVNELADVLVKDTSGTQVRNFVDANSAPETEVRSTAFTGVDYDTAASAVGNPTTLQAILDRWLTINGAPDWKISLSGVDVSIQAAIAALIGTGCNVKNPDYAGGATGDGVADDTAPIEAAIADCVSKGGGNVFFPPGTYKIISTVTVSPLVSLVGSGAEITSIVINAAANPIALLFPGDSTDQGFQEMQDLSLVAGQANTSELLQWTDAHLLITDCIFGDASNSTGTLLKSDADVNITLCSLQVDNCLFRVKSANGVGIHSLAAKTKIEAIVTKARLVSATDSDEAPAFIISPATFSDCLVDFSANTLGNPASAFNLSIGGGVVTGCRIIKGASDGTGIIAPANGAAEKVVESGNDFGDQSLTPYSMPADGLDTLLPQSLRARTRRTVDNDATFNATPGAFGHQILERTAAGVQDITLPQGIEGQHYTLTIWNNNSGSNIVFTWVGAFVTDNSSETVNNNMVRVIEFVCATVDATPRKMVQIGTSFQTAV